MLLRLTLCLRGFTPSFATSIPQPCKPFFFFPLPLLKASMLKNIY